jgi:hypothetical protein
MMTYTNKSSRKISDRITPILDEDRRVSDKVNLLTYDDDRRVPEKVVSTFDDEPLIVTQTLNPKICQMLKLHVVDFYDILGIRWERLRFNKWIFGSMLDMQSLILLRTDYFVVETETLFLAKQIYDKYCQLIGSIFHPKSLLVKFMKMWTKVAANGTLRKDPAKTNGFTQIILQENNYWMFSPIYIIDIVYKQAFDTHGPLSPIALRKSVNTQLKHDSDEVEYLIELFKQNYDDLLEKFVSLPPEEKCNYNFYDKLMFMQLTFTEVLIDKSVYAARSIVDAIIGEQLADFNVEDDGTIFYYV